MWVVWLASGANKTLDITLPHVPGTVVKAERMPFSAGDATTATYTRNGTNVQLTIGESPTYVWITSP